jgi:hypothetical protein
MPQVTASERHLAVKDAGPKITLLEALRIAPTDETRDWSRTGSRLSIHIRQGCPPSPDREMTEG